MTEDTNFLDTQQAARFLKLSVKTLARYRVTGEGPAFHRFGNRIRYRRATLDACTSGYDGALPSDPDRRRQQIRRPSRSRTRQPLERTRLARRSETQ